MKSYRKLRSKKNKTKNKRNKKSKVMSGGSVYGPQHKTCSRCGSTNIYCGPELNGLCHCNSCGWPDE